MIKKEVFMSKRDISQFNDQMDLFAETINNLFLDEKNISIFGAGSFGIKVYEKLIENNINVINFYDNDRSKHNTKLLGVDILNPADINTYSPTIVIASLFASEILEKLRKNGYSKKLIIIDPWYDCFNELLITKKDINNIKDLYIELEDESSKKILSSLIQFRMGKVGLIQSDYEQYFHSKIYPSSADVMIDGGAFDGDLIRAIDKVNINSISLHCFEPDDNNFILLNKEANESKYNIFTNKFGLWSDSRTLKFLSSGEMSSSGCKVVENGDISINTISIDEYVKTNNIEPTYIKLDVEGAEYETLIGAKNTIKKLTPKLAISVYHKYKDLWELYALIKSINPKYKFFLGHHTKVWYETVLYAVAKEL
jgi:FkbM family methyltransferase